MAELPLESDELFVPIDAVRTGALADVGLSAPRFFPSPLVSTPDGLVCVGGRLAPEWLLDAYRHGIFPWPVWDDEPMAWWSLDPRAIFEFECVRISQRLTRTIRSGKFEVTCDRDFEGVIRGCGNAGDRQEGTWLTPAMIAAYCELHRLGHAHSVEVWHESELVGGTYGVAIGGLFAAESMFYRVRDASKVAVVQPARPSAGPRLPALRHSAVDAPHRPTRRDHDSAQRLFAPAGGGSGSACDIRQRARRRAATAGPPLIPRSPRPRRRVCRLLVRRFQLDRPALAAALPPAPESTRRDTRPATRRGGRAGD